MRKRPLKFVKLVTWGVINQSLWCLQPSNEKGRKAFTTLVMRIWDQYEMKSFLQRYLREIETQYTCYKRLLTSPSESSSTDEDESSSTDEDEEDVELDEL